MNTMRMLGAHVIQGHTLGESVVMPELGNVNEQVFGSIDLVVFQARQRYPDNCTNDKYNEVLDQNKITDNVEID